MTAPRRDGEGSAFGNWLRHRRDLPSTILSVTDADWIFQRYHVRIDGIGKRKVQCLMFVEAKTYGAYPTKPQAETLFLIHQLIERKCRLSLPNGKSASVWSFGVFVLRMSGERPDRSDRIEWGQFDERGRLEYKPLSGADAVARIIGFETRPDTMEPLSIRRHHKRSSVFCVERTPLGFATPTLIQRNS